MKVRCLRLRGVVHAASLRAFSLLPKDQTFILYSSKKNPVTQSCCNNPAVKFASKIEILHKIVCINSQFACSVCILRMLSLKSRCYTVVKGYKGVRNLEGHSILATSPCWLPQNTNTV